MLYVCLYAELKGLQCLTVYITVTSERANLSFSYYCFIYTDKIIVKSVTMNLLLFFLDGNLTSLGLQIMTNLKI